MKKTIKTKKKVVGAIGLAIVAVGCVGVGTTTSYANNGLSGESVVKAYADDVFKDQWDEAIAELKKIDGDISAKGNYLDYLFAYINAADAYVRVSASVTPEDYLIYEQAGYIIRQDADCYRYFANDLSKLYVSKNIRWSNKVAYDSNIEYFDSLDTFKQEAIVDTFANGKFNQMREYAEEEFTRIIDAMDAVKKAIEDIYYSVSGDVVVDTKDSLDIVEQSINKIYNIEYSEIQEEEVQAIASYVTNLGEYDKAFSDYNAIIEACAEMDKGIVEAYESFTTASGEYFNKHYTQRSIIEALRTDYNALNRAEDDDATKLVTESAKLEELESILASIDDNKLSVENLIADIPDEFNYTEDYISVAYKARDSFDELPDDLKAIAITEISGYTKLTTAIDDIERCDSEVKELIERAEMLKVLYDEGSDKFTSGVNEVANGRAQLTYDKQKADFDAECGDVLFDMQTKQVNLAAKIKPFLDAVSAIGDVKLSNGDIGNQINRAYEEYAKLNTTLEQNAVLGSKQTLDQKKAALDKLMTEANEWKNMVEAINLEEKISTTNIKDINAVEACLDQIKTKNLDMYTVISTSKGTYGYSAYEALIEARDNLLDDIKELANEMAILSTDLSVIVSDPTVFNQAVEDAGTKFNEFHDSIKGEYFTDEGAENSLAYSNYEAALNIYVEIAKLAGDIASLYDIDSINMMKYESILAYNDSYNALSIENKDILKTQKINADKTFEEVLVAATEKVTALKEARDTWADDVYALAGNVEMANWETNLYAVNLDEIANLKTRRDALDNTDGGLNKVDADFANIEKIGNSRVTDLNNLIAELDAKAELEKGDVEKLETIYDIYNNKLDQTQKDLVDYSTFEVLYNKYVFAQNFDDAVTALYNDVIINGNYTSKVPVTIGILRSIYINFGSEMKALIQEYGRIEEIEQDYNTHVGNEGDVLNLTAVYKELSSKIDLADEDLYSKINELATDVAELKAEIEALEEALEKAQEELAKADEDNKAELNTSISALQGKLEELKTKLEKADADIIGDIANVRDEIKVVQGALEELVADTKAELLDEISSLRKSLKATTIALSIVSGLAMLGVVVLFIAKKKND